MQAFLVLLLLNGCNSLQSCICPPLLFRVGKGSSSLATCTHRSIHRPSYNRKRATTITAVGLTEPIQALRDATQSVFNSPELRAFVLSCVIGGVTRGAASAWKAGEKFRQTAAQARLGPAELTLLFACILIDAVGDSSFLTRPGELGDVIWAPISALLVRELFDSNLLAAIDLGKELLPWTDFIPVATLSWLLAYGFPGSAVSTALGINVRSKLTGPKGENRRDSK